jgi:hypothetical protein
MHKRDLMRIRAVRHIGIKEKTVFGWFSRLFRTILFMDGFPDFLGQ